MIKNQKKALITGITGQDGSYLAEFLLKKGYVVFGLVKRKNKLGLKNIEKILNNKNIKLIHGDLGNKKDLLNTIKKSNPDEIYNLAAVTDDLISFKSPKMVENINYKAFGNLVEIATKQNKNVKIFQAGSAKIFDNSKYPKNENSKISPTSPYGKAKSKAYKEYVIDYREKYNFFICSGILFNHESERSRGSSVVKKVIDTLVIIKLSHENILRLGDINSKKDWGYAKDYVEAMWKMLQQKKPEDFVIATGEAHSVRELVEKVCKILKIDIIWKGKGIKEKGIDKKTGKIIIEIDPKYFRPNEVSYLCGDISKANKILGWRPRHSFEQLLKIMVKSALDNNR